MKMHYPVACPPLSVRRGELGTARFSPQRGCMLTRIIIPSHLAPQFVVQQVRCGQQVIGSAVTGASAIHFYFQIEPSEIVEVDVRWLPPTLSLWRRLWNWLRRRKPTGDFMAILLCEVDQ